MHIKDFDPYDFSKKEIEGVTVYYKNLPWAPCIHLRFTFSVGAFNDPEGKEGLAHFLEHMIGNGCPSIPDKKAMKEFSRLYMLNSRNASTSYNWTSYEGRCLPEYFLKVFRAMTEYVSNPFLRPEDVEHERKIITQEAWNIYKNDKFLKYVNEFNKNFYGKHDKARVYSPLGWPKTIEIINQEDVKNFHKNYYVKENLSIFLVGNIEEKDLSFISDIIKDISSGVKVKKVEEDIGKPKVLRIEKTGEEIGNPKKQLDFSVGRAVTDITEEEIYTGNQMCSLLYDILFERLRVEHSLCYSVAVSFRNYKGFSEGGISVGTSEEKLSIVEKEIWNVINEIIDGKWGSRFEVIHQLQLDQIRSNERLSHDIIFKASKDIINRNKIETLKDVIRNTEKISYDNIKKFTKKIFDKEFVFTEVIAPSKNS